MPMQEKILECVPNISEGRDRQIIDDIAAQVETVEGVRLLDVDPGHATNRTVITFVGPPEAVVEAAFRLIKRSKELIDMRHHKGEHPRMGATDVCPLIPVAGLTLEEAAQWAHTLAKRVGEELQVPVYMYEAAATRPERKNLADIRAGEYEALPEKLTQPEWKPDYGPAQWVPEFGAIAIGARDFLIAYNVNLNTTSVRRANAVAFDIREKGRVLRKGHPLTGEIVRDEKGNPVRIPGKLKGVKAIGWYIEEYGIAQVTMNITDIHATPLHIAFEACRESARQRGMRVTGSELVGLVPKKALLDAGKYYLRQQQRSTGIPEREIIRIAVKSLGLDELASFDIDKKIIEYRLQDPDRDPLVRLSVRDFTYKTASESPAPGGGSASALAGALGAALGTMVANLSAHKRGWDERWEYFSQWAEKGQQLVDTLLQLVDEDTRAFNAIIDALRLPKGTEQERQAREQAILRATKGAVETPLHTMQRAAEALPLIREMVKEGNPASITDAGVAAVLLRAAALGAWLNVRINLRDIPDEAYKTQINQQGQTLLDQLQQAESEIIDFILQKI